MSAAALRIDDELPVLDPDAPGVNVERVRGVVLMSPRPRPRHAHAAGTLHTYLNSRFGVPAGPEDPGGWLIFFEPEIEIGEDDLIPDLAGWHADRAPQMDEGSFMTAPDWVCEVLSPGNAATDRSEKMPVYAAWGVGHVWLLDPVLRTLEVYRLEGGGYRLVVTFRGPQSVRAEPFHAMELPLSKVWPPTGKR